MPVFPQELRKFAAGKFFGLEFFALQRK